MPWLEAWLVFNVAIAVYEVYIVMERRALKSREPGCASRPFPSLSPSFWMDAWGEYACHADRRYFDEHQFVHWIEFGNAVIVAGMWWAYLMRERVLLKVLLIVQAYHCGIYFLSLLHYMITRESVTAFSPPKRITYLLLSAAWVVVPLSLVYIV
jgi:hypothetical protein